MLTRRMRSDDVDFVYQSMCDLENEILDRDAFMSIFQRNINHTDCYYLIAEVNGKQAGFITLHIQHLLHHAGLVGEIQEFYVLPENRNSGIGKLLTTTLIEYVVSKGVVSLEVTTNMSRTENVMIYKHLGFDLTHHKFTKKW